MEEGQSSHSEPLKSVLQKDANQEGTVKTQAAMRSQATRHEMDSNAKGKESQKTTYDAENDSMQAKKPSPGIASTWESMKIGFHNFKSRIEAKKFIPLRQVQDTQHSRVSSSESLDEIFERINRPTAHHTSYGGDDDHDDDIVMAIKRPGQSRWQLTVDYLDKKLTGIQTGALWTAGKFCSINQPRTHGWQST